MKANNGTSPPPSFRRLRLDAIEEENFRSSSGVKLEDDPEWKALRRKVLERDEYTCRACGFKSAKYMEVHHFDGKWSDNNPGNLFTLCPLCHSCLHIGLAGIKGMGTLLILKSPIEQARLNALILRTVEKYGKHAQAAVDEIKRNLPVEQDLGADGLMMLANKILAEKKEKKSAARQINEKFVFFPDISKYHLARLLMEAS